VYLDSTAMFSSQYRARTLQLHTWLAAGYTQGQSRSSCLLQQDESLLLESLLKMMISPPMFLSASITTTIHLWKT
jgi:hypothetical protein